ncbi:MAG TPA: M28 family peptidase [Gaiellaceae bacterium]|nr:M28 family peptidase [Gaiellaceae bacterium]
MTALPPSQARRRPRPGSLARPVNGRLYRGTWLLVALPLLVTAFTVARPGPLPAPVLPPVFDGETATQLARDLATSHPDRSPGSEGSREATAWLKEQLEPYGMSVREDRFEATIPDLGSRELVNLIAVSPGRSNRTIVIMAHRDNAGTGPGANDNASGTAALVELARSYAPTTSGAAETRSLGTTNTLVFLSTDGGAFGGLGAAHFASESPYRNRTLAVVNLAAVAGDGPARIEIAGDRPRSPAMTLVRTAAARVLEQTGRELVRPRALGQLIDLGFPFTLFEQGPFVSRGISAITLTTAGPRPPSSFADTPEGLNRQRLTEVGRSAQALIGSLDQSLELAQGTQSFVFLGSRVVRGWAIQVSLIAALLPFLLAAVDLFARCRRRHIRIAPALRSLRSRLFFWLWVVLLFIAFSLLGWGEGEPRPLSPESAAATEWPFWSLVAFGVLALAGWLVARDRLLPRRPVTPEEELAGHTAALLALGVVALLVVGTNPFALIFVLPALHAWLWLPQVRFGPAWVRAGVYVAGFAGPLLLLSSFARRFELGADAPWYLAKLAAVGYVEPPALLIAGAWLAAAAQLAALTAGRYAPYPAPGERGRRGPIRSLVGTLLGFAVRGRQRPPRRAAVG